MLKLQRLQGFFLVLQSSSGVEASRLSWDCRALVLHWLVTVRNSCGDFLESISHIMGMEVHLFHSSSVISYLLGRPFDKNWGDIGIKCYVQTYTKGIPGSGGLSWLSDCFLWCSKIWFFCEKDNRNLKTEFANFAMFHREVLSATQIFPECWRDLKFWRYLCYCLVQEKISVF